MKTIAKSIKVLILSIIVCVGFFQKTYAQDKEKPAIYTLPDPLVNFDGTTVTTPQEWMEKRRPQILDTVKKLMYGQAPPAPKNIRFKVFDQDENALHGKAQRKQVSIFIKYNDKEIRFNLLVYYPKKGKGPYPVFLGLNFQANDAVNPDPGIRLSTKWVWAGAGGAVDNHPTEKSRGAVAQRWPIQKIIDHGYAVATIYAGDIDPDYYDDFKNGIHALYPELQNRGDNFSTIAAWAWGLSRGLDYFETDPDFDASKVAVFGFSRMGKAALWAGASDQRFAITISNDSGGGGAALSKRKMGEDIARLNNGNKHWFSKNFKKFNKKEEDLPFDQHMVIALVAPRPVYVASAIEDTGSDPKGEFLAAKAASPVYKLFGKEGLPATSFPKVNHPVMGTIGYHVRSGNHNITKYDWEQYLKFADKFFK